MTGAPGPKRRTIEVDAVAAAVARHVRALRQAHGWSLDELAARSGVSKGMVVQIEGAKSNPSIGTLCRLAESFGVSIARLVESTTEPRVRVIAADEPATLWHGRAGGTGRLLCGVNDPAFVELWDWRMPPGEVHWSADHAAGTREVVHAEEGSFTVTVDGTAYPVRAGETIDFLADRPHEYRNDNPIPALLTMVVVMPPGEYDRR